MRHHGVYVVNHNPDSVTLYHTLSHFSTQFLTVENHGASYDVYTVALILFTLCRTVDLCMHTESGWCRILFTSQEPQTIKYIMTLQFIRIANIYVRDRNYSAHVSLCSNGHVHVFKYCEQRVVCEYRIFNNHLEAAEYLELLL